MAFSASLLPAGTRSVHSVVRSDRSGRLFRTVVASVAAPYLIRPSVVSSADLDALIDSIAEKNSVEPPLVHSVIRAESNYNPGAVSPKGALGMMQLIPATASRFGVTDAFDPAQNIEGGVKYLKFLLDLYHQDYTKTIAAYNAGEGAVARYGGVPPYQETRTYVTRVSNNLKSARATAAGKNRLVAEKATPAAPEAYQPIVSYVGEDGKTYYRTP
jgi:soluble lytic murein transglycosylase-like protein